MIKSNILTIYISQKINFNELIDNVKIIQNIEEDVKNKVELFLFKDHADYENFKAKNSHRLEKIFFYTKSTLEVFKIIINYLLKQSQESANELIENLKINHHINNELRYYTTKMREYENFFRATPIENYYLSFENKFFSKNPRFLSLSKNKIKYHEEIIRANQFEFYLPNGVSIPSVIHFYTKNTLNLSGFLIIKLENSENLPNFVNWKISKNNVRINLKCLKYLIGPLKITISAEGFKDDDQVDFYLSPIKNGIV